MTKLDSLIKKDMTELYNGMAVSGAMQLNSKAAIEGTLFSTHGLPSHFLGNRDAKTVIVMLNPGENACIADYMFDVLTASYNRSNDSSFIDSYTKSRTRVLIDRTRHVDPFDIKQAAFLMSWLKNRISIPPQFPWCDCSYWDAVESIQRNRLQLEIVPYSAKAFGKFREPELLMPYLETVFDEIASIKRDYVIFGSDKFADLFKYYNDNNRNGNSVEVTSKRAKELIKGKDRSCSKIKVNYNGQMFPAIIAHSYFSHAFANDYLSMQKYGEFCYKCW